ncbi:hypothetical protein AOQ84DRAFT_357469 [Glonium stellatum]|uniref:Uncharacterized protein n=1 Tax=Glonium stellatum TaxID=574774 RepID=A0A8E2EPB0_9PEZI|nr:hypothetical protein AOQ84DRAFT_357469 [Glonium stellatum]
MVVPGSFSWASILLFFFFRFSLLSASQYFPLLGLSSPSPLPPPILGFYLSLCSLSLLLRSGFGAHEHTMSCHVMSATQLNLIINPP